MIRSFTFVIATIPLLLFGQTSATPDPSILQLTQYQFDADTCCWRIHYCNKEFAAGAALVEFYLKESPNARNRHSLRFHAGQLHALDGNYPRGIYFIKKTFSPFYQLLGDEDGRMWYYYAKGIVAFLQDDGKRLQRIVQRWERKFPRKKNYEQLKALHDAPEGQSYFDIIREYRNNKSMN